MPRSSCFWIYILECDDGSYYTGYTKNLVRRYRQHVDGIAGVKYTRSHRPVRIAQCWRLFGAIGGVLKVENLIKSRGRKLKESLIQEPAMLRRVVKYALEEKLRIFTMDPRPVEHEAGRLNKLAIKTALDPFRDHPRRDLHPRTP